MEAPRITPEDQEKHVFASPILTVIYA
jgi:hypothetical protein